MDSSHFLRWSAMLLVALGLITLQGATHAASFPAAQGRGGAVAAGEGAATQAGIEILRAGGNAVDAAVATALALAVVQPDAGNLGGGGFAVVKVGKELASIDFRETAPRAARRDMYLDSEGRPDNDASREGPLAAGAPGTPTGLHALHQRFGRLPWRDVVEPAHRLAVDGFVVSRRLQLSIAGERERLERFPETAAVWLPGGEPPQAGSRLRLPALAATLESYAEHGPTALTSGPAAEAIERVSKKYGGVLRVPDVEGYRPAWRQPLTFEALGWRFASMDLPASGGIILAQALSLLESLDWRSYPRFGATRAHLLAEVLRRSFADRYLLGDPATTQADSRTLLDPDWLELRRSTIRTGRATPSAEVVRSPQPTPGESSDTTHLSVADADGNLVALTITLNDAYGCALLVPELGYFLNNQMDDFATAPGHPNMYGLVQGEANAVGPGKRMLSSMAPTIALRGSQTLVLGARGGGRIPTAVLQVLLNLLVDGDPLQAAVDRPRLHHQWLPDLLRSEPDALSPETREMLEKWGHEIEVWDRTAKVHAVRRLADGRFEAAADPRGPGVAGVVDPLP
jgi:gamma-glutamyltranspeptidase/glutathione hydrolase